MKLLAALLSISLLGYAYCEETADNGDSDSTDPPKSSEKTKCSADDDCLEGLSCKAYLSGCDEEKVCMCGGEAMTQVYHPKEMKCFDLATEINATCAVGRQCWKYGQRCPYGGGNCVCENADDTIFEGYCVSKTNKQIGDACDDAKDCYYINDWGFKVCGEDAHSYFPFATCDSPAANPKCACPSGLKRDGTKCLLHVGKKKAGEECKYMGGTKDSCEAGLYCKSCHKDSDDYKCRSGQDTMRVTLGLVLSMLFAASLQRL